MAAVFGGSAVVELEGLSSFYHLAKPQFTMMRRAPSAND